METKDEFEQYEYSTRRISDALERIRQDILSWVERHREQPPSITEVALLEGYHAERIALVAELLEVEKRFMNRLLQRFHLPESTEGGQDTLAKR